MLKRIFNIKSTEEIELKGDPFESFERIEKIYEIILLGEKGGVRRIILDTGMNGVITP